MTPQEKAKELVNKFIMNVLDRDGTSAMNLFETKQCVLLTIDEILKANPIIPLQFMLESESLDAANEYWQEVKEEIENLKDE